MDWFFTKRGSMSLAIKWDVVAGITGILALGLTFGIYLAQRTRRVLEYSITTEPLATISEGTGRNRITLLFDGQPVDAVYYTTIVIRNTGNAAIRPEDFVEPVSISTTPGGRLIQVTAKLHGGSSEPVSTSETIDGKTFQGFRATYKQTLLNPGDELDFFVIHSAQVRALLNVNARVADAHFKERSRQGLAPDGFISDFVRKNY